ncbi:MAG: molybdopterin molybdenumtransferase MoeA, partial [Candidatus Lindowbacteria bacterium]|nr:molybdopterin molybdenumtransferase MoeA [Candidatus Lindowbacteria bacterium]
MKTISVREAIDLILGCVSPMSCKDIPIQDGLGFVLGEDVVCRDDVPYQDNSAMDGYAIRSQDIENASQENPVSLRALPGMIAAGEVFQEAVS